MSIDHDYIVYSTINQNDFSRYCRDRNLYTNGTVKQYRDLLDEIEGTPDITTDDVLDFAENILEHSDIEQLESESGLSYTELLVRTANDLLEMMETEIKLLQSYTAYLYDEYRETKDSASFSDKEMAVKYVQFNNWDEIVDDATGEVVYINVAKQKTMVPLTDSQINLIINGLHALQMTDNSDQADTIDALCEYINLQ